MKVALTCTGCGSRNYRTTTEHKERLSIRKYCKTCNRHQTHKSSI
ncbi:50S ribosomal protein L33 [Salinicoccus siamensis]|uniref:Large ribosomal subunit protein bL33 n=1 Tax=Salinicoccus siamensis TaxID=381830 RepID=A0ABV5Z507_9STAP